MCRVCRPGVGLTFSGINPLQPSLQAAAIESVQTLVVHDLQHVVQDGGAQVQVQGQQGAGVGHVGVLLALILHVGVLNAHIVH